MLHKFAVKKVHVIHHIVIHHFTSKKFLLVIKDLYPYQLHINSNTAIKTVHLMMLNSFQLLK